jgi:hypothetical protein
MGHQNEIAGDGYGEMKEDVACRLEQAETVGLGFALPPAIADVVRIVRRSLSSSSNPDSAPGAITSSTPTTYSFNF